MGKIVELPITGLPSWSQGDSRILEEISRRPGITVSELAKRLDRRIDSVSHTLQDFKKLGLVCAKIQGRSRALSLGCDSITIHLTTPTEGLSSLPLESTAAPTTPKVKRARGRPRRKNASEPATSQSPKPAALADCRNPA